MSSSISYAIETVEPSRSVASVSGGGEFESGASSSSSSSVPSMAYVENIMNRVLEAASAANNASSSSQTDSIKRPHDISAQEHPKDPLSKRVRVPYAPYARPEKLEYRLETILSCSVCLDLPKSLVYQCTNGHLMCSACFSHLLADARIRDEPSTCPKCRCVISKDVCCRNLAVEKAVCELPEECRFCMVQLPRHALDKHLSEDCDSRLVECQYAPIGCHWKGPHNKAELHFTSCSHPHKPASEVLDHLSTVDTAAAAERKIYEALFNLLSFEKISINDLQFRPYRTDEYIHKLFYETSRFTAFNMLWVVKARLNDDQRDPTQSIDRQLSFSLSLKTKLTTVFPVYFLLLKGPQGDLKVPPKVYRHIFSETASETISIRLNKPDTSEVNRLVSGKVINFRLIMFTDVTSKI